MAECSRHPGNVLPGCHYCRTGTEPEAFKAPEVLTVGELKEHIVCFTDLGAVFGNNLGMDKKVMLRVHGHVFSLSRVAVTVHEGLFVLMLDGEPYA